jgi:large subunit ribosomal protein L24
MQTARPVTKPNKQRKFVYDAPRHIRHKLFAAHLSPELRGTHLIRSFPLRSGDTVRIMRGDHKGFEGKVSRIEMKSYRVYLEGLTREKVDGTTIFVAVHPSKVMITHLNLDDKWRKNILERKQKGRTKPEGPRKRAKPAPKKIPPESLEPKEPVTEEKMEQPSEEETKTSIEPMPETAAPKEEEEAEGEKETVTEKPRRKRAPRAKRTEKSKQEEAPVEETSKVEKKRARRRSTKKTEEGA